MLYDWLRALHIIAVMSWMAGMLYLPRLYVYHATAKAGGELAETLKVMERRLLRFIINPAMIASYVFGIGMLVENSDLLKRPSMHAKFTLLVGMQVVHALLSRARRQFAADANRRSARYYRILNEVPTLLMVGTVILVVVKPF